MSKAKTGHELQDFVKQAMADLERDLCRDNPEMAMKIGSMHKERIDRHDHVERMRKESEAAVRSEAKFDERTELALLEIMRHRSTCYRPLPDGGGFDDQDRLEFMLRRMIDDVIYRFTTEKDSLGLPIRKPEIVKAAENSERREGSSFFLNLLWEEGIDEMD